MSNRSSDHMANERTFLAWVRTSIGIMAFGFVLEKFALFVKQINLLAGNYNPDAYGFTLEFASSIGFVLVIAGVLISVMGYVKFRITANQIQMDNYKPYYVFDLILTLVVFAIGVLIILYLANT